ncbi:hypothetical protein SELMODRAFT_441307 [Selaginella moellendorffii]|uniref:BTB domain-containing protein n=1 Tax=Selaginella moellendorffii TaxID=88036 RepID=D8RIG2_SELML|nr:uncharacterized protein LOC9641307 [Selaginella moellendorffii]XP_024531371.1 uncharacterized protein LOC9641307 [Selaginella moellendorffii]XP_024531372.1 uncharacterized protein LOC9641307 [Selaginella moellendorffii]EFJ28241.1 hypothetical protein SELMODRAFT_441307 [Selaginella moellendorffii]|eukprot:XP_002970915.1 uncharacterized protein LOC9641307 [Selaginella moellendorffii]
MADERLEPVPRLLEGDQALPIADPQELPPKLESLESVDLSGSLGKESLLSAGAAASSPRSSASAASPRLDQVKPSVEVVGLSDDAGHDLRLDQATFFRCVEDGNVTALEGLLKNRKLDVNAYNDDGMTALHLAVYKYEQSRNLEMVDLLIKHGASVCAKAAGTPATHRISIIRHDVKHTGVLETRKVDFHQKPPLLVVLELKSSLYLKGWEYRHWDSMLKLLAEATIRHYVANNVKEPTVHENAIPEIIQKNWKSVFHSGKHETIELWAEGRHIEALKLLLSGASKILKLNIESNSSRIDMKDASFNIVKAMVEFLYTGHLDASLIEQRGIDLFVAAHKYGVDVLKLRSEAAIVATPDNWIKLLSVATECNSDVLAWKCATSIKNLMDTRQDRGHTLRHSFSESHEAPQQLFQPSA